MKLLFENWREYVSESSEDESISIKDVHKLADTLNISWDEDAEFMRWTKGLTGKSHLDKMTSEELSKVYSALEKRGKEDKKKKGPNDFFYQITKSPDKITINVLDLNKNPVESKKKGTNAYISLEKRTEVPNWEVAWASSPENSEKVGTEMYLMALELAKEGLAPDSYETSHDALRVWYKFMKKNKYGVIKKLKQGHEGEDETDPVNFVFFKPEKGILDQYKHEITKKEGEKSKKGGFDPEKEEKFEDFDPNVNLDDYLTGIDEQTEPYQQFSKKTYRVFIKKLGKQGKNKYNVGRRMQKPSTKHLKSGPPGG